MSIRASPDLPIFSAAELRISKPLPERRRPSPRLRGESPRKMVPVRKTGCLGDLLDGIWPETQQPAGLADSPARQEGDWRAPGFPLEPPKKRTVPHMRASRHLVKRGRIAQRALKPERHGMLICANTHSCAATVRRRSRGSASGPWRHGRVIGTTTRHPEWLHGNGKKGFKNENKDKAAFDISLWQGDDIITSSWPPARA